MVAPHITPEQGVARYENDLTQGPACAIACGAGTIYRNYFVTIDKHTGQTADKQIDCLADFAKALPLTETPLWEMKNGYALANLAGLQFIKNYINSLNAANYEALKGTLRIGLQWNTEVTISPQKQLVSQAYCSALPVAYSFIDGHYWIVFIQTGKRANHLCSFWINDVEPCRFSIHCFSFIVEFNLFAFVT